MRMLYLLLFILFTTGYSQGYRGAELRTLEPLLYGKFEVCYKPAQGEGLVLPFLHITMITQTRRGMKLILNF